MKLYIKSGTFDIQAKNLRPTKLLTGGVSASPWLFGYGSRRATIGKVGSCG